MWEQGQDSAARAAGVQERMTTLLDQEKLEPCPRGATGGIKGQEGGVASYVSLLGAVCVCVGGVSAILFTFMKWGHFKIFPCDLQEVLA